MHLRVIAFLTGLSISPAGKDFKGRTLSSRKGIFKGTSMIYLHPVAFPSCQALSVATGRTGSVAACNFLHAFRAEQVDNVTSL